MKDVSCPYCEEAQDINHDDGQGYDENTTHQQWCSSCRKYFVFTTSISYYYEVAKADCLNGSPHKFKPTSTYPKEYTRMRCVDCDEERAMTKEEKTKLIKS